ncbi:MAG TPA: hypothetical protein VGK58_23065, partial [Lacipirellulaceae bacterium]
LCAARKRPVIPVSSEWYGIDPIHVRRRVRAKAWPTMLAAWRGVEDAIEVARSPLWTSAYLACLAPHERSTFGIRRRKAQPSGRLSDGTTISLY